MNNKYLYKKKDSINVSKHGINLKVFPTNITTANVVRVSTEKGHFQEFYDKKSTYIYYILEGEGVFILNDEKVEAKKGDLVVVPPNTKIHYFGKLDIILTVSPAFDENNEVHVRFVDESESPYN
jgi:mannose-6-phosphate isomerase-like protein (cupin superfamily)